MNEVRVQSFAGSIYEQIACTHKYGLFNPVVDGWVDAKSPSAPTNKGFDRHVPNEPHTQYQIINAKS